MLEESVQLVSSTLRESPPDILVVNHGITEAIIRPSPHLLRYMPPRWRRPGWMDPRPYYSSRPVRRALQWAESATRWRLKNWLIAMDGGERWATLEAFEAALVALLDPLQGRVPRIVLVSHFGIDSAFFPGSAASLDGFWEVTQEVAVGRGVCALDLRRRLDRSKHFLSDGFHPNVQGHRVIAEALGRAITDCRNRVPTSGSRLSSR